MKKFLNKLGFNRKNAYTEISNEMIIISNFINITENNYFIELSSLVIDINLTLKLRNILLEPDILITNILPLKYSLSKNIYSYEKSFFR